MEVSRLLHNHPDYERWIRRSGDEDLDRAAFVESSIWPDEIRKDRRFYTPGVEEPTPLLPGFPDMERHGDWHSIKIPMDGRSPPESSRGQIDRQLKRLTKSLSSGKISDANRSYAMSWLIHLAGDSHQPLHTTIRLGENGEWDRLGQGLSVINPFNPRREKSTLHEFWDDLPGPSSLRGAALEKATRTLILAHPPPASGKPSDGWIEESWQIALNYGYPHSSDPVAVISRDFYEQSREIANRRVTEAGYRLAETLNKALGKPGRKD